MNFKKIFAVAVLLLSHQAVAGTCSSISRTNVSSGAILTSTEYNNSLNTAYSAINAADGGCISTGTLETDALNTTQFAPVNNGVREGCRVTITDANTLSIDRCQITVNGNYLKTTVATSLTWGCSGCASETASTLYYVYVNNSSTFGVKISTTAPNGDGYNASSERVLARFWENASSDIVAVDQWTTGSFFTNKSSVSVYGASNGHGSTNTAIRRFDTTDYIVGTAITYADSATNGGSFTINSDGIYAISYYDIRSGSSVVTGISKNSNQLTTSITSLTNANIVAVFASNGSNTIGGPSATVYLRSGDVIRAHDDGNSSANGTAAQARFTITKISD